MDWNIAPDDPNHVRLGPISTTELVMDSDRVRSTSFVATIRCSCGWGMRVSPPGGTSESAENEANGSWRQHLATVTPPLPGENFYAATRHPLPGPDEHERTPDTDWYWGAVKSDARWRRGFPKWTCDHKHGSEAEAVACAEEELKKDRWHPK